MLKKHVLSSVKMWYNAFQSSSMTKCCLSSFQENFSVSLHNGQNFSLFCVNLPLDDESHHSEFVSEAIGGIMLQRAELSHLKAQRIHSFSSLSNEKTLCSACTILDDAVHGSLKPPSL